MAKHIKIAIIGAGSVFTPELIEHLIDYCGDIGNVEIRFMDIDQPRLAVVFAFCERILTRRGAPFTMLRVSTYQEAIEDADFIVVQFRQGGISARIADEKLGLKYQLPFTETVSVCGISTYLRTFPIVEELCELINRLAPTAWVLNFTNPAEIVSEYMRKLGCQRVVGLCNGAIGLTSYLAEKYQAQADDFFLTWRGLNHLTITDGIFYQGKNIIAEVISMGIKDNKFPFPAKLLETLGVIPNSYFQYYLLKDRVIDKLQAQAQVRSETVQQIDSALLEEYRSCTKIPESLKQRGGYGYSHLLVQLINSIVRNNPCINYAIVENGSTIPELPADAFIEAPVVINSGGVRPIPCGPLPEICKGLMITMKVHERMLLQACATRSKSRLLNALLVHPLIPSWDVACALLDDIIILNQRYMASEYIPK